MTSPLSRLVAAWERSDALFRMIAPDALLDQPIPLRQPLLFYLGHLPAFMWNQVCRGALGMSSFNAAFDALFERGIDPVGVDTYRPAEASQWPATQEVLDYRDRARDALRQAYGDYEAQKGRSGAVATGGARDVFLMAIEHELMHQETLLYMLHELPHRKKVRPEGLPALPLRSATPPLPSRPAKVRVPYGRTTLGAPPDRAAFGWDNEFPERAVDVPPFMIDTTPVRNGEYLEFVRAGGYSNRALWTPEGWAWKERQRISRPLFWGHDQDGYRYRSLFEDVPLEEAADWPVYVSHAEASAFAAFRGARLPSEAELHRATYGTPEGPPGAERLYPWGDSEPRAEHGNFHFQRFSPAPVGSYPEGASAWGALDLVGNGWEWTGSLFEPFPGFEVTMPSYPGYSSDFFDGQHYVLLGASWATDAALVRRSFRNWFQPHYPYVFAKFRCVTPA